MPTSCRSPKLSGKYFGGDIPCRIAGLKFFGFCVHGPFNRPRRRRNHCDLTGRVPFAKLKSSGQVVIERCASKIVPERQTQGLRAGKLDIFCSDYNTPILSSQLHDEFLQSCVLASSFHQRARGQGTKKFQHLGNVSAVVTKWSPAGASSSFRVAKYAPKCNSPHIELLRTRFSSGSISCSRHA